MDQSIINYFLTNTLTKNQAMRRLRLVKEFMDLYLFKNTEKKDFKTIFDSFKQSSEPFFISQNGLEQDFIFLAQIGQALTNTISADNLNSSINQLEQSISKCKTIILYLPFEAQETEIGTIGNWIKQNLGPMSLLEIDYDPLLIGGCAISFNGNYKDYSLRAKINENKKLILDSLLRFRKNE